MSERHDVSHVTTVVSRAWFPYSPWRAAAWYVALTVAMTWPLSANLTSRLPNDLGDPVLNCWILAWNADHLQQLLTGHPEAWRELWHGNIFYPERYTLGYSEVLLAQSIQALPIWAATRNIVLGYNVLFLSTFALSGLGMFLLVREWLKDWRVAFVAGLLFAFIPYRAHQASHIQVMTNQWMPFALYGFERAVALRRWRPLVGGSVALVAQNLSCGYFLVFFSLFVPPFVVAALVRHRRAGDIGLWVRFTAAALVVGVATLPFLQPYFALRDLHDMRRSMDELVAFSADTWSWLMPAPDSTIWSRWLAPLAKPEGSLFPGAIPVLLALVAIWSGTRRLVSEYPFLPRHVSTGAWYRVATWVAGILVVWGALTFVLLIAGGGGLYRLGGLRIRIQSLSRSLEFLALGTLVLFVLSDRMRKAAAGLRFSPLAFAGLATVVAAYLSLGPQPQAGGDDLNGPPLYSWLYQVVPGVDGLRVPARFAAVGGLFLVLTAGFGLRDLLNRWPKAASPLLIALSTLWLLESAVLPFPVAVSVSADTPALEAPPSALPVGWTAPAEATLLATLPADAALLHLPLGDISWELQYMYGSIYHWRNMVNGYSGYAPRTYLDSVDALRDPTRNPERAWNRVLDAKVTHIAVHRSAYRGAQPPSPYAWLAAHGAILMQSAGGIDLFRVTP